MGGTLLLYQNEKLYNFKPGSGLPPSAYKVLFTTADVTKFRFSSIPGYGSTLLDPILTTINYNRHLKRNSTLKGL